jgi:Domain of unknown function (DUF4873)
VADDHDGYEGPATLTVDGRDVPVHVLLDARHEPQDGKLHWFGRMTLPGPVEGLTSGRTELSTAGGRSEARVGEVDPWGRYRVTGVGMPPFAWI